MNASLLNRQVRKECASPFERIRPPVMCCGQSPSGRQGNREARTTGDSD